MRVADQPFGVTTLPTSKILRGDPVTLFSWLAKEFFLFIYLIFFFFFIAKWLT
jgi:hypothetical protein